MIDDAARGSRRTGGQGKRRLLSKATIRDDVERELEAHVRMRADELVADGWAEEEGLAEARRLLGDQSELAEACVEIAKSHQRAVRRTKAMDAIMQDLRYGLRTVVRSPGFALVAILTLALGIGANTAMFSVVDGVLLESLPYPDPEELVDVREARQDGGSMSAAWLNFVDWREQNTVFDEMVAYTSFPTTVIGGDEPVTTNVAMVSQGVWSVFGVTPLQGRLTVEADHVVGGAAVVVVSESYWRNQLGARPIEEVRLDLNGVRASVVGVAPATFDYPMDTDVWQPLESTGPQSSSRTAHNWRVVGRLRDGVDVERADEELDAITARVVLTEPDADPDFLAVGVNLQSLRELVVGSARWTLLVLLGAAGLVLLIACTNLASTLLARGANRTRELAVRASMGAGQSRLVRLLITESLILAAAGAAAGVGVGWLLVDLLRRTGPATVPRLQDVGIDGSVRLFAVVVTGLTTLLFGLFPAIRLARSRPQAALR
ncbi:MAG: ABC transporter permease, partial [Gemmatimonadetes bacterium]|nr:ABC transporter permease [Gemmatimonadota bacterium]